MSKLTQFLSHQQHVAQVLVDIFFFVSIQIVHAIVKTAFIFDVVHNETLPFFLKTKIDRLTEKRP